MIILLHVCIALLSIVSASWAFIRPSRRRIYLSCGLVVGTLLSGTYLVLSLHSPLMQTCETGLTYLAIVSFGIAGAWYRLARRV